MRTVLPSSHIVYVIDPDAAIGEALSTLLDTYQIAVQTFPDAECFLQAHSEERINGDCLIVEANLPGLSGLSLCRELNNKHADLPVILLTGVASPEYRQQAQSFGAVDVLEKPLMNTFLLERLSSLLPRATNVLEPSVSGAPHLDGTDVTYRVMRPEDADIEQDFVRGLSEKSKHLRFFSAVKQLSPSMLEQFTHTHYPDNYALIATTSKGNQEQQIAVARYFATEREGVAEFAVVVADEWQGHGIASNLMHGLTAAAAIAGVKCLEGLVLRENKGMRKLAQSLGFTASRCEEDATVVRVVKTLGAPIETQEPSRSISTAGTCQEQSNGHP